MTADWQSVVLDAWAEGQRISAVGPGDLEAHVTHARRLVEYIEADARVGLDLGSGAGIPGLALAGLRPDMAWILVDAALRRTRILTQAVAEAGWTDRVTVVHGRAELLPDGGGYRDRVDVVTARLFGPPAVTAECAAPLLAPGGQLLVTEPPDVDSREARSGRWDPVGMAPLGLSPGARWSDPAIQELRRTGDPEARFPRKPGVAAKRPLW